MSRRTMGIVGGGRVARILLEGWTRAAKLPASVIVSDPKAEALATLKARCPSVVTTADNLQAAGQDLVFLALHPPAMAEAGARIKASLKPGAIVVSLAPKFTIAKLTELFGGFARLARMIPNAPSVVDFGFNPVCFGAALLPEDKAELLQLLEPLGECPQVEEPKLEGYALLTGMGPTYLWFQLQVLREVAVGFGLTDAEVGPALKRMVCGGARTLLDSGLTPAEVMDLIPVKPLAEMEAQVSEMYRTRLPALFERIKPRIAVL